MINLEKTLSTLGVDANTKQILFVYVYNAQEILKFIKTDKEKFIYHADIDMILYINSLCIDSSYVDSILNSIKPSLIYIEEYEKLYAAFNRLCYRINYIHHTLSKHYYSIKEDDFDSFTDSDEDDLLREDMGYNAQDNHRHTLSRCIEHAKKNLSDLVLKTKKLQPLSERQFIKELIDKAFSIIARIETYPDATITTYREFKHYQHAFTFVLRSFFNHNIDLGKTSETHELYHMLNTHYCLMNAIMCTQITLMPNAIQSSILTTPVVSMPVVSNSSSTHGSSPSTPPRSSSALDIVPVTPQYAWAEKHYQQARASSADHISSKDTTVQVSQLSLHSQRLSRIHPLPESSLRASAPAHHKG